MELAVKVMRQSVPEPRKDGKASPRVGAVLIKPGGAIEAACRGELRHGDHAEFTLLERKNRHNRLDGSVLFATLEPCAPDSRHAPKMSCTERIVLSRIKEVWVGIEDPDPKVDRKGIKALQDAGIKVHMFDRDLQEAIRAANKDFLKQAVARAQTARNAKQLKEQALSPLENALPVSTVKDFSGEALERYRSQANIAAKTGTQAFNRHLIERGLLREEKGRLIPTGFGFLLFGKNPRRILHQAGILATIRHPNGKDELLDFDEPLILIPDLVEKWLSDKLPSVIDRSRMRRETRSALPFEMVREAVINALIHRDYDIRGAKCQLMVNEDAVTIMSPGAPPPPITLEQLQSFNAPMLSRNPVLHYVFSHMGLAEERGLGVKTLKAEAEKEGLPLPKYRFEAPYLALTLFRTPEGATHALANGLVDKLNADERAAWQFASTKEALTSRDLMDRMKFDERKAQRVLSKLLESKLLRRVGRGPATRYETVRS